jgi:hypothetical protein
MRVSRAAARPGGTPGRRRFALLQDLGSQVADEVQQTVAGADVDLLTQAAIHPPDRGAGWPPGGRRQRHERRAATPV